MVPIFDNLVFGRRFDTLVGTVNFGQDPALGSNRKHKSYGYQNIQNREKYLIGSLDDQNPRSPQTASFQVSDNTFGTYSVIELGDRYLRYGIDWIEGASTILTATNIVSAINGLGGPWEASNGGTDVVSITFSDNMKIVRFDPKNFSTVTNFDASNPDNGFMSEGNPSIESPIFQ